MKISVIIPVRNELQNGNLPSCLGYLLASNPKPDEILVVDDSSYDGTISFVKALNCSLIKLIQLPPKQSEFSDILRTANGKTRACLKGAELARGDLLIFIDADVRVRPGFLSTVAGYDHSRPSFWWATQVSKNLLPRLICPFMDLWQRYDQNASLGQVFVIPANLYRQFSPHACVLAETPEDIALRRYFHRNGIHIENVDAEGLLSCRMFQSNLEAYHGYRRLLYPALSWPGNFWLVLALQFFLVTLNPAFWLRRVRLENRDLSAVLHPVSHSLFLILGLLSWWSHKVSKKLPWKGRNAYAKANKN